jgi:hypothetical protein
VGCQVLRIPQCLDSRLADGGKVDGLTSHPPFSGMLRPMALVRTDDSEEHITTIIMVERIREVGTMLASFFRCWLLLTFLARRLLPP